MRGQPATDNRKRAAKPRYPCVPVAVVSVGGGGGFLSFSWFAGGGGTVSVVGGPSVCGGATVVVPLFIGGFDGGRSTTRGRGGRGGVYPEMEPPVLVGSEPAIVPGGAVVVAVAVCGKVKAVVVSAFVFVIAEVVGGGGAVWSVRGALAAVLEPS